MEQPDYVISAHYHPMTRQWSHLVVDHTRAGTHENYHIVANGICQHDYRDSEEQAKEAGRQRLRQYLEEKPWQQSCWPNGSRLH